jgi:hypothetical protein
VLNVIARNRDPESFLAGGVPINRQGPRYSNDIDIFHDAMERVGAAAHKDAEALTAAGFTVTWQRQLPSIISADISRRGEGTKLEWVADSDYRYFPPVRDDEFGYVLHAADLAVNKLMAAVGRREPRDIVDLLTVHEHILPLGAVVWAAVEVAPGFTPEGLVAELRRNGRYTDSDFRQLATDRPIDAADVSRRLKAAISEAELFITAMPSSKAGRLFLENGQPVQPEPARLSAYIEHLPRQRGHWPSSPEISRAMLEQLRHTRGQRGGRQ